MQITANKINEIVEKIKKMAKYKDVEIPAETIQSLIELSYPVSKNSADLEKRIREKIHNITALYLGDINYKNAIDEFRQVKNDPDALKAFSHQKLTFHASTKERGHDLSTLYQQLFSRIGNCKSIADLACGIHPLGLPFMGLPLDTSYYAYDLNKARVDFLNLPTFHPQPLEKPANSRFLRSQSCPCSPFWSLFGQDFVVGVSGKYHNPPQIITSQSHWLLLPLLLSVRC